MLSKGLIFFGAYSVYAAYSVHATYAAYGAYYLYALLLILEFVMRMTPDENVDKVSPSEISPGGCRYTSFYYL